MDTPLLTVRRLLLLVLGLAATASAEAPIRCGTAWLRAERQAGRQLLPAAARAKAAQEATAIKLGTELLFPVGSGTLLRATCQRIGTHSYVFVENRHWDTNGGAVLQSHVDALGELFDDSTPADASSGIFELETRVFGDVADVDGDARVFLLVLDVPGPAGIVGYFDPAVATYEVPELRRDVLFIDETFLRRQSRLARGTLAHEFQHMIHWRWDDDEDVWVDEGLSGYAEELTGFPEADPEAVAQFLEKPYTSLTGWDFTDPFRHYGATYLFMSFIAQRYGTDLVRAIVAQPQNGTAGVDVELTRHTPDSFTEVWQAWSLSNVAGSDGAESYAALGDRRIDYTDTVTEADLPLAGAVGSVSGRWGTTNILFRVSGHLTVDFDGDDGGRFDVRTWAMTPSGGVLQDVNLDAGNRGVAQLANIDSAVIIVGRTSLQGEGFTLSARRSTPTAVAGEHGARPAAPSLGEPYPNPFNSSVRIPFELAQAGSFELVLTDVLGRTVRRWYDRHRGAGSYQVSWDGSGEAGRPVASGMYVATLRSDAEGVAVRTLTLLR